MEIVYDPYKKVSFKSYQQYESAEVLVNRLAKSAPAGVPSRATLHWANGVLFQFVSPVPNAVISKELLDGHIIWDVIEFASMPIYRSEIQGSSERPLVTINVMDVSNHTVFGELTKWIKDHLLDK